LKEKSLSYAFENALKFKIPSKISRQGALLGGI